MQRRQRTANTITSAGNRNGRKPAAMEASAEAAETTSPADPAGIR